MTVTRAGRSVAVACVMALSAMTAQATTLDCKLDTTRAKGWVRPAYQFTYDLAAGTSTATHCDDGCSFDGKASGVEGKKVVLTWSRIAKDTRGRSSVWSYRAAWFPAKNMVTVRATPGAGYRGNYEGRGSCVVVDP